MLTGQRVGGGEDVSDTLANVLKMEPAWERLLAEVPARIRQVLRGCLQKNSKQRIGDVQDVRLALEGAFEMAAPSDVVVSTAPLPLARRKSLASERYMKAREERLKAPMSKMASRSA